MGMCYPVVDLFLSVVTEKSKKTNGIPIGVFYCLCIRFILPVGRVQARFQYPSSQHRRVAIRQSKGNQRMPSNLKMNFPTFFSRSHITFEK